jgi:hypothetical protein
MIHLGRRGLKLVASADIVPPRFPPPWSVDNPDMKLGQATSSATPMAARSPTIYFEDDPGRRPRLT